MTTQTQINAYNSALFSTDGAQKVRIGKTVYSIVNVELADDSGSSCITIKKGNTVKSLIPDTIGGWTLWSGRIGLPKMVSPEFI